MCHQTFTKTEQTAAAAHGFSRIKLRSSCLLDKHFTNGAISITKRLGWHYSRSHTPWPCNPLHVWVPLAYCAVLIRLVGSQSWLWDEIGKDKAHCFLTIVQPLITSNAKELIWIKLWGQRWTGGEEAQTLQRYSQNAYHIAVLPCVALWPDLTSLSLCLVLHNMGNKALLITVSVKRVDRQFFFQFLPHKCSLIYPLNNDSPASSSSAPLPSASATVAVAVMIKCLSDTWLLMKFKSKPIKPLLRSGVEIRATS